MEMEQQPGETSIDYRRLNDSSSNIATPSPKARVSMVPHRERLLNRSNARTVIKFADIPPSGYYGFLKDGFTTVLNSPWYSIIFIFCFSYIISWLVFGLVWWGTNVAYRTFSNYTCISNAESFTSTFLFSVETQVTIGYGFRFIDQSCRVGVFLLLLQCLIGLLLDSFMLGLVFAKLTRPRNRRKTILFSELAVIRPLAANQAEEADRVLEFRIADVRRSQLVEAHVRATVYWYKENEAGEDVLEQYDLDVGYDTGRDRLILLAPIIIQHRINTNSPLYSVNEENILDHDIEIVVALEGIVESTGLTVQALWSYTEREINFNHKFRPMIYRKKDTPGQSWEIDFSLLSRLLPINNYS